MAQTRRNIVLGVIGVGIVGALVFITVRPEPVPVDLYDVARGDFEVTVDVDGTSRVVELFEIAAPISGIAQRSPVRVGDPVVAHETIVARVEPLSPGLLDARTRQQSEAAVSEAEAALQVAETELARAVEDFTYARQQNDRTVKLVERGVATITRLEDTQQQLAVSEAGLNAANARIAQAESALERARAALIETSGDAPTAACCVSITAPADGVVLDIDQISARPVTAGARLLSVGDPSKIELVADLLSSDAVALPPDARAHVERWGGPPLQARLSYIEPTGRLKISALGIEEQRVDAVFELLATPEEQRRLGHEFAVYLRIVAQEQANAMLVPLSAAFRVDDGWAVFRADGNRVTRVPVELGPHNARFVVVLSGLSEGERIVEHPREDLADGALIVERTTY